jgi:hypothetical protein
MLLDGAASKAAGADPEPARATVHERVDLLEVDLPVPLGHVVGVTDVLSVLDALSTEIANLSHDSSGIDRRQRRLTRIPRTRIGRKGESRGLAR